MFSRIKFRFRYFFEKLGINNFANKTWFNYLAFANGVRYEIDNKTQKIYISKNNNQLIIKFEKGNFGSSGIVLRDFDNIFNTVNPEIVNKKNVVDFSVPKMHTLSISKKQFLFHDICEPISVTDLYLEYGNLKEGDVVFDIGTYAGTQTVFFSEKVGEKGKVYAFEPDNNSFESLEYNIKLNNVKNVIPIKIGLYNFDGKMYFSQGGSMGSQIIEQTESEKKALDLPSIEVAKIETIIKKYNIERVDYIKMDIEGAELAVLKSSENFIKQFQPRFIIEPHFINGVLNKDEIIAFFKNINYDFKLVKQGNFDYQPLIYASPVK